MGTVTGCLGNDDDRVSRPVCGLYCRVVYVYLLFTPGGLAGGNTAFSGGCTGASGAGAWPAGVAVSNTGGVGHAPAAAVLTNILGLLE